MDIERRLKYGGKGKSVSKTDLTLDITLDLQTLDMFCRYIVTNAPNIRRGQLINMRNLIYMIDRSTYENDFEKSKRVSFIKKGLEGRIEFNLTDMNAIMKHINGGILDDDIVDTSVFKGVSGPEIDWLNKMVAEALKFSSINPYIDRMMSICSRIKSSDYGTKGAIIHEFETLTNEIQNSFRKCKNESQTEMTFSLRSGVFESSIYDIHSQLRNPSHKIVTGMQGMNELLGGGFESTRVYVFLALPGEGKTTTMLNLLLQIKKSNRHFKTKDPTKTPCVVLLTMENSVRENVDTLFSIATDGGNMKNMEADEAITVLRTEGELFLTGDSPIDIIIKYVPNKSVDTSYLYTLTEDLEDDGYEVIAFMQDYLARIRSVEPLQDTRLEFGAIVDEFKTFATIKDIPVITASQLNREASRHIDEGRKANRADLVRVLGRSNIGESLLILNNADGAFILAPEYTDTEKHLGVQKIKLRYKTESRRECVYLPYNAVDGIKLLEDYDKPIPIYKASMRMENPNFGEMPMQSPYHTNKIRVFDQTLSDDGDHNIFNSTAEIISSGPIDYTLGVACRRVLCNPIVGLIQPIVYDE